MSDEKPLQVTKSLLELNTNPEGIELDGTNTAFGGSRQKRKKSLRKVTRSQARSRSPSPIENLGDCLSICESTEFVPISESPEAPSPAITVPPMLEEESKSSGFPMCTPFTCDCLQSPHIPCPHVSNLPSPTEIPEHYDRLVWSDQSIADLQRPDYWLAICPHLHINDTRMRRFCDAKFKLSAEMLAQLKSDMMHDGFLTLGRDAFQWAVSPHAIAVGVVKLMQYGWAPPFIMIFDEPWVMAAQLSKVIELTTDGNQSIMDWFAWYVDPLIGGKGWPPHRDRADAHALRSFRPSGAPFYSTVWIPLTDALPENSCLHILPAYVDPGYRDCELDRQEMMDKIFGADYGVFQDIRAIPLKSGSIVQFGGRILHWGSRGKRAPPLTPSARVPPRIAMSFAASGDEFEKPYISREHLPLPPLVLRLALVASQAIVYNRQEPLPKARMDLYQRAFMTQQKHFDPLYTDKIGFLCQWFRFARVIEKPPAQLRKGKSDADSSP